MKISSASKKVLASALSAAMVVAFAPTVAFGAQAGNEVTLGYDLNGGQDVATGVNVLNTSAKAVKVEQVKVGSEYVKADPQPTSSSDFNGDTKYFTKDGNKYTEAKAYTEAADVKTAHEVAIEKAGAETSTYKWDSSNKSYTAYQDSDSGNKDSYVYYAEGEDMVKAEATEAVVTPEYYVLEDVSADGITLSDKGDLQLKSGSSAYRFLGYEVGYDENGDGDFDDAKDVNVSAINEQARDSYYYNPGEAVDLHDSKVLAGMKLTAKAVYDTPVVSSGLAIANTGDKDHKYAVVSVDAGDITGTLINGGKVTVKAPSGATVEKATNASDSNIVMKAEAGEWTTTLTDGNGVVVEVYKQLIGHTAISGGVFNDPFSYANGAYQLKTTSLDVFYDVQDADTKTTYSAILNEALGNSSDKVSDFLKTVTAEGTAAEVTAKKFATSFYDAAGALVATVTNEGATVTAGAGETAKGASENAVTARYAADEAKILSFKAEDYKLTLGTVGVGDAKADQTDPSKIAADPSPAAKYYVVITDASGKIVAETADTDGKADNKATWTANDKVEVSNVAAGTYTATLYKVVGPKSGALDDTSAGSVKAVSTATVEVKGVAAPTWTFAAETDATKTTSAGTLTLASSAGADYDIFYTTDDFSDLTAGAKYDSSKAGIAISTSDVEKTFSVRTVYTGKDTKVSPKYSDTVKLVGYKVAHKGISVFQGFYGKGATQAVNGKVGTYYNANADVKAAIAAAEKTFKDAGFKVAAANGTEWNETIISADKAYLEAVAKVAKGEIDKLYAGTTNADGSVSKLTEGNYKAAVAAADKVVADFAANHDADATNNVAKNGEIAYSDTDSSYVKAIDAALQAASKAVVKYAKADVDAAKAVNDEIAKIPAEITAANAKDAKAAAEAAVKAYGELSATQKELVSSADYVKAVETITAADAAIKAADKAAVAKAKGKTVKAKASKKTTAKLKAITSEAGTKVTYAKTKGNAKVTVSKAGKITVKKGLKAGKTYTVKASAKAGTAKKTITIKVKVAK